MQWLAYTLFRSLRLLVLPVLLLLLDGSPAIDAGAPTACADTTLTNNEDQRGIVRPINGDGKGAVVCDIGAVEVSFEGRVYLPLIAR